MVFGGLVDFNRKALSISYTACKCDTPIRRDVKLPRNRAHSGISDGLDIADVHPNI
jgi:hypothetical protein